MSEGHNVLVSLIPAVYLHASLCVCVCVWQTETGELSCLLCALNLLTSQHSLLSLFWRRVAWQEVIGSV